MVFGRQRLLFAPCHQRRANGGPGGFYWWARFPDETVRIEAEAENVQLHVSDTVGRARDVPGQENPLAPGHGFSGHLWMSKDLIRLPAPQAARRRHTSRAGGLRRPMQQGEKVRQCLFQRGNGC